MRASRSHPHGSFARWPGASRGIVAGDTEIRRCSGEHRRGRTNGDGRTAVSVRREQATKVVTMAVSENYARTSSEATRVKSDLVATLPSWNNATERVPVTLKIHDLFQLPSPHCAVPRNFPHILISLFSRVQNSESGLCEDLRRRWRYSRYPAAATPENYLL